LAREEEDAVMNRAKELYRNGTKKDSGTKMGLRAACKEATRLHCLETGRTIEVCYSTLSRQLKGKKSKAESNAEKGWLSQEETEQVVALVEELGERGFPPDHRTIKEFVDAILSARLGDAFPEGGVGKKWSKRFVEKHSDRI
ncbi:hypothetical protein SCHPADRAFT_805878, partial [Schizopora paradoxa]